MRRLLILSLAAISAAALTGCSNDAVNTNAKTNANNNTIIVTNANNTAGTKNTNANTNSKKELSKDEYEKDKESYAKQAKDLGRKIGQGAEDGWLWTKTRADLLAASDLRDSTINVDVDNAVVTLSGTVAAKDQVDKAVSIAKAVSGVKDVKNELKVAPKDSITNTGSMTDSDKKPNSKTTGSNTNANKK